MACHVAVCFRIYERTACVMACHVTHATGKKPHGMIFSLVVWRARSRSLAAGIGVTWLSSSPSLAVCPSEMACHVAGFLTGANRLERSLQMGWHVRDQCGEKQVQVHLSGRRNLDRSSPPGRKRGDHRGGVHTRAPSRVSEQGRRGNGKNEHDAVDPPPKCVLFVGERSCCQCQLVC